ncbi:MAG: phytanoyl-CoA dioxygenase family protein, partial [Armatimonadaceae bacterium]
FTLRDEVEQGRHRYTREVASCAALESRPRDATGAVAVTARIEPVACPCPAGSAVFHNGLTAHGAGANMTNKPRRAMTCAYMPEGSTFNGQQNVLPTEYFEKLAIGDRLDNPVINPLIWRNES